MFCKTVQQNYKLLQQVARFCQQDIPVLVGLSRKSMIGAVLDVNLRDRE